MKRKKLTFTTSLSVPETTSSREAASFVRRAISRRWEADEDEHILTATSITVKPVKPAASKKAASPIHNPADVPASKLPKGRRFMTAAEREAQHKKPASVGSQNPLIWMWERGRWNKEGWYGDAPHRTYCVPLNFKP